MHTSGKNPAYIKPGGVRSKPPMEFGRASGRSITPPPKEEISLRQHEAVFAGRKRSYGVFSQSNTADEDRAIALQTSQDETSEVEQYEEDVSRSPSPTCSDGGMVTLAQPHALQEPVLPIELRASVQPNAPRVSVESVESCAPVESVESCASAMPQGLRAPVFKPCYLCLYSDEPIVVQYVKYIMTETARSSRQQIAHLIAGDIAAHEQKSGRSPDGASVLDVERHIALHMLHPSIKVPELIRELDDMRRLIRGTITNICPDTGAAILDNGNMSLYLRVVRELQQVYKLGDQAKLSLGGIGGPAVTLAVDL
jgi:hypothetical protein